MDHDSVGKAFTVINAGIARPPATVVSSCIALLYTSNATLEILFLSPAHPMVEQLRFQFIIILLYN